MSDLISTAKSILAENKAAMIIGYAKGTNGILKPFVAKTESDCEKLEFDSRAVNNLSVYLTRLKDIKNKKIAVVSKGCDTKSINALIQENKLNKANVYIIGMNCKGVANEPNLPKSEQIMQKKCKVCVNKEPKYFDAIFEYSEPTDLFSKTDETTLPDFDKMSNEERWAFWQAEFEKCIKCYACRQACPLCYCEQCIVDKTQPRWIKSSSTLESNFAWNAIRAFHLAGRCIGCNECERACPAGIPLSHLNKKMGMVARASFNYTHGASPDEPTLVGTFDVHDKEDFIK